VRADDAAQDSLLTAELHTMKDATGLDVLQVRWWQDAAHRQAT
jgi:hypothetical protein